MELSILLLGEKLKKYDPQIYINQTKLTAVQHVELFVKGQKYLEPGVLYILPSSEYSALQLIKAVDCNVCLLNNPPIIEKFDQYKNYNLLVLNKFIDLLDAYNKIETILDNYFDYVQGLSVLNNLLFQNTDIQQVLDTGCSILKNPIVLQDPFLTVIAHSLHPKEDLKTNCEKSGDLDILGFLNKNTKTACIQSKIFLDHENVAMLSLFEKTSIIKESDRELFSKLCRLVTFAMQKEKFNRSTQKHTYKNIILDLIDGQLRNSLLIDERIKHCQWALKKHLYILTIEADVNMSITKADLQVIRKSLKTLLSDSKSIIYNDGIVLVTSYHQEISLIEEACPNLKQFLSDNHLYAGLSKCFHHIKDFRVYYLQSLKAKELGLRLDQGAVLYYYENFALFHLLDICSREEDLKRFRSPSLMKLMNYDQSNHTFNTFTLYIYLKHGRNHKKTADELHLSPSTLVYRLSKIKRIIGTEINSMAFSCEMLLSFKILMYMGDFKSINGGENVEHQPNI